MIARSLPGVVVAVGRHRDRVGRAVEERFGSRVHILDDGFQHLRLERDLNVLCLSSEDLADWPLPAGDLREFPSARSRADVVVVPKGEEGLFGKDGVFTLARRPLGFYALDGTERPAPRRPFLLSGIARPERFRSDVLAASGDLAGLAEFPDHHPFRGSELKSVQARARSSGADAIVTTAKDAVRLPPPSGALPVLVFRIAAEISDEPAFKERLLSVARRAA
jgi:tetraacyldisaccharide 4'-kinase